MINWRPFFRLTDAVPVPIYGGGSAPKVNRFYCNGDEEELQYCHSDSLSCDHTYDAGVICFNG